MILVQIPAALLTSSFFQPHTTASLLFHTLAFELSIPLTNAHKLPVVPSSSIYYLIPTNEFETHHARDAHKIEVAEVSEEHPQGRHRAGQWKFNAASKELSDSS